MTAPMPAKKTVQVHGVSYHLMAMPAKGDDPCHWCAARNNMRLCDVLCPGCGFGQVFIRSDCKKYVR
jgi:hypothetical protein